jgi:hypothetical protein
MTKMEFEMNRYREEIKDGFISELGINPLIYDRKRGYDRTKSRDPNNEYVYDKADEIIMGLAGKYLHAKKKYQLFRTFHALYHCKTISQVQKYLSSYSHRDVETELPVDTVKKYTKRSKEIILREIIENATIKDELLSEIKNEYER